MKPKRYRPMHNLKWLRNQADLDQADLAKLIGVCPVQISNYETGKARPRPKILRRIAKVLHVTLEDLAE